VLATILFVVAGIVLGGLLLPRESVVLQALLGVLLLASVVGWMWSVGCFCCRSIMDGVFVALRCPDLLALACMCTDIKK